MSSAPKWEEQKERERYYVCTDSVRINVTGIYRFAFISMKK
jgi:hypothetical protein